jgi:hypothetical protein
VAHCTIRGYQLQTLAATIETMGQIIGTLILTEMMINPAGVGRANGTWFEFYNPTNTNVVVVNVSSIALHNDQDIQLVSRGIPDGTIIPPGGYYVIGRSSDVNFNGGVVTNLTFAQGMIVSDVRGRVRFFAVNQLEVVNVEWKNSSFPFQAGASLTYNLSALPTNGTLTQIRDSQNNPANWFVTNATYGNGINQGTPGRANTFAVAKRAPTKAPSKPPTRAPTKVPSTPPTTAPLTKGPAKMPSRPPTTTPVKGSTKIPTWSPLFAPVNPVVVPSKSATRAPVKSATKAPMASLTKKPTLAPSPVRECKVPCKVGRSIRGIRFHRRTRNGRCVEKCKWLFAKTYVRDYWRCGPCP